MINFDDLDIEYKVEVDSEIECPVCQEILELSELKEHIHYIYTIEEDDQRYAIFKHRLNDEELEHIADMIVRRADTSALKMFGVYLDDVLQANPIDANDLIDMAYEDVISMLKIPEEEIEKLDIAIDEYLIRWRDHDEIAID